jgi:5-bromo-4-chloroindolyl phosphate hydrolysis protein
MESILKADIFFVVTTIVVLVLGILLSVLLVYAIRTAHIVKKTVQSSSEYIEEVKNDFKKQGALYSLLKKVFSSKK